MKKKIQTEQSDMCQIENAITEFLKKHGPATAKTVSQCIGCDAHDVRVLIMDLIRGKVLHVVSARGNEAERVIGVVGVHNQMALL
jgi:predicted ArsR family transcriptional regulator